MAEIFLLLILLTAGAYSLIRSSERAFLDVYLPILLLFPPIFHSRLSFLPELSPMQVAIIPIFIVSVLICFSRWKFTLMDFFVGSFILIKFISEYYNWGDKEAYNVLATQLCDVWAPYALAKLYIIPNHRLVMFSKRFVFILFILVILAIYEFLKMGNLFVLIPARIMFPGQDADWGTLYRYGFVRIASSFVQTILFAMGLSTAIFLNYWLIKEKVWPRSFSFLPLPRFLKKSSILMFTLIMGLLATSSRGPQLSTLIGFCFVGVAQAKARTWTLIKRMFLLSLVGVVSYYGFQSYTSGNKEFATEAQSTILYRVELIDNYWEPLIKHPYLGWGRSGVPIIAGQRSVDNEYLSSALQNGVFVPLIEILILVITLFRLIRRGLANTSEETDDSIFAFVLFGIFFTIGLSLGTVYMGLQIQSLFFIMLGITEGYLHSKSKDFYKNQVEKFRINVDKLTIRKA